MVEDRQKSILVVEDDPAIRRLVTMVLQRAGYNVDIAADGLEAVLKLGLHEYDVIILDLMLPHVDGFTFLETLGQHAPENLHKVIVTSAASPALIRERLQSVPFAVLPKPFDLGELLAKVKACLE